MEDVSFELDGAQLFSKLDLSPARACGRELVYNHVEQAFRIVQVQAFKLYGTNLAAEIFRKTLQGQLQGLKGVKNISNDIIVHSATREEHDENLDSCLKRLLDRGLRLNRSKCTF